MANNPKHAVTGAFGYSGKYIAQKLLARGYPVITITNSVHRQNPFGDQLEVYPYNFDQPGQLVQALTGVSVMVITYWVRFNHKTFTHADAVRNTKILFDSAVKAGVERIVYVSITNPSEDSQLEYFRGKGELEKYLQSTGVSYAILRPAVLFGREDILINNIAWTLRKLPVFGVFGDGGYRLQPIYVDDLADIAVEQGENRENIIMDCIGPENFTYLELVEAIGEIVGKNRPVISVPPWLGYLAGSMIGKINQDQFITREEIKGLMAGLLYVDSTPAGKTRLTDWARQHADTLGLHYSSELLRRRDRTIEYKIN